MRASAGIPRVFHWIWLGEQPIPEQHEEWMTSWRLRHPSWTFRLWRRGELPTLRNRACFDRSVGSYAQQADIARYEILQRYGGVYLDTDMECLRPLDDLLHGCDAVAGFESSGLIGNAILGCRPDHPWLSAIVAELPTSMDTYGGPVNSTGPGLVTRCASGRTDICVFECDLLYGRRGSGSVSADAYAIHHYASSWVADAHTQLRQAVRAAFAQHVPTEASYAVLDAGVGVESQRHPFGQPFYDTTTYGLPVADSEVIDQFHRLRTAGVKFLVVTVDCFWWLDHYKAFAAELQTYARPIVDEKTFQLYELQRPGSR